MKTLYIISTWIILALYGTVPAWGQADNTDDERMGILSSRIEALENQQKLRPSTFGWIDRINISGLLEAEAGYSRFRPAADDAGAEETSDIVLSTMELGIDVGLHEYVSGHILLLWEEDGTEPVDMDEGFITVSGGETLPFYLNAGKFYIPFGRYESYFISDPLTLELGETNESAVLLGYTDEMFELAAGFFNGDVEKTGTDDRIGTWFGSAAFTLAPSALAGWNVSAGVSYLSSIADSDLLEGENDLDDDGAPDGIRESIAGISGFLTVDCSERFFLIAEYTGALDHFTDGELAFGSGKIRPMAWNTELIYLFEAGYGIGLKYEGARDTAELLPEKRYGAIGFCQPFEGVYLGLEYLRETYENEDEGTAVTVQLAYEF